MPCMYNSVIYIAQIKHGCAYLGDNYLLIDNTHVDITTKQIIMS